MGAVRRILGAALIALSAGMGGIGEVRADPPDPRLIRDINPGPASSGPEDAVSLGRRVVFLAYERGTGLEPWTTRGTRASTRLLADVTPGEESSDGIFEFWRAGRRVFFQAPTADGSIELWGSDGTPDGTGPVTEVCDPEGFRCSFGPPRRIDGQIIFHAYPNTGEPGIWRLAPASKPGAEVAVPGVFMDLGAGARAHGAIYAFREHTDDDEVWRTDGTRAGTRSVTSLGNPTAGPNDFVRWRGDVYFTAEGRLGGGRQVFRLSVGQNQPEVFAVTGAYGPDAATLTTTGDGIFFADTHPEQELWFSNGTAGGTEPLAEGLRSLRHREFAVLNDKLIFVRPTPILDSEVWTSDGTSSGTHPLTHANGAEPLSEVRNLVVSGDRAYFTAFEDSTGIELWATDGSADGTRRISDLSPGPESSHIHAVIALAGGVMASATDGRRGIEPWLFAGGG